MQVSNPGYVVYTIYGSINPSPGRYFPLKYLFGTCLNNLLINHSHTVLLLHICQCEAERWGDLKKNIFGDVVPDWEGLKTEVKRGRGIATRRFIEKHRGRNGQFFLSILVAHRLSILQGYPLKHFS